MEITLDGRTVPHLATIVTETVPITAIHQPAAHDDVSLVVSVEKVLSLEPERTVIVFYQVPADQNNEKGRKLKIIIQKFIFKMFNMMI